MAQPSTLQPAARTLVVSLDFGTHGSGFAYAAVSGGEPRLCEAWPDQPRPGPKTRTALLYQGRNVVSWGWSARSQVAGTAAASGSEERQFVDSFKLALAEGSTYALPTGLSDIQTAADFLWQMRRFIMAHLRTALGAAAVHPDRMQWCLTVPAMWTDAAKHKMRQAAVRSGIIPKLNSGALLLILEPEAAALHASRSDGGSVAAGDVFMVLDAGGGTVDLTLHRVVERAGQALLGQALLVEAAVGAGDLCGSTFVDDRWEAHCRAVVGPAAYDAWVEQQPQEHLWMQSKWEAVKCDFDVDPHVSISVSRLPAARAAAKARAAAAAAAAAARHVLIPAGLGRLMTPACLAALQAAQDGADDRVLLPQAAMLRLFDPVVDQVVLMARKLLQRGRDARHVCTKVLLVGGFAESPYLQRRVRAAFEPALPVVVPSSPAAAVLQGAVLFGRQPGLIGSRCSRLSYGVRISRPEQPSDYNEPGFAQRRWWSKEDSCYYDCSVYEKFVDLGQVLGVDECVSRVLYPITSTQERVVFDLYATDKNAARFTTDATMHKVGNVTLGLPAAWSSRFHKDKYGVQVRQSHPVPQNKHRISTSQVSMHFGLTELKVEARDMQGGTQLDTSITFAQSKLGRGA